MKLGLLLLPLSLAASIFASDAHAKVTASYPQEWRDLTSTQAAEIVSSELNRCPCWDQFDADEVEIRAGIIKLCARLNIFSDAVLAAGIRSYWRQFCVEPCKNRYRNAAKVFLLIRVLYEVPERLPRAELPESEQIALGPYLITAGRDEIEMRWPLSVSAEGTLVLNGSEEAFAPSHAPYNGVMDFDFISGRFNRRIEEVKEAGQR